MSVKIKKIYLQNYKLFTDKEVIIGENLSVFDGPNGYGKTSIFDAVEFLITGKISRVEDSDSISGVLSFESNFLAKDIHKDVVIKGEFSKNGEENLILALCIPSIATVSKRTNNPKYIGVSAKAYKLKNFNLPESEWHNYFIEKQDLDKIREDYFGKQNLEHFTMIHYVHQEDRLAYFKKSENDRTDEIQKLFGIANEDKKRQIVDTLCRKISKQLNSINTNIAKMSEDARAKPSVQQNGIQYFELIGGKAFWDKKEVEFKGAKSKQQFEECIKQLSAVEALTEWKEVFLLDKDLRAFEEIPNEDRVAAIKTCILDNKNPRYLEQIEAENSNIIFLIDQLKKAEQLKYIELNYGKICDIIKCSDSIALFDNLVYKIKMAKTNETELQESAANLADLRKNLHKQISKIEGWKSGQCPYCGNIWKDDKKLQYQFLETERLIIKTIGRENVTINMLSAELKRNFEKICLIPIQAYINERKSNADFNLFKEVGTLKVLRQLAYKCKPLLQRLNIDKNSLTDYNYILGKINELKVGVPIEYDNIRNNYSFDILYNEYFKGNDDLDLLSKDKIELKKLYLQDLYFNSFEITNQQLFALKEQREKLSQLQKELKCYGSALNGALKAYREQVIGQIEIPFFLYSSRLLQSYQSGQGVMIKTDGKSVRFICPGAEHDVLYTMSSGQLSAVLLSFSLALNKIYAGDSFKTLLIDDPVQCMDDINMVSFIELLRLEFKDTQVMISTHEDNFSKFIQYKFEKYNQKSESINLHG